MPESDVDTDIASKEKTPSFTGVSSAGSTDSCLSLESLQEKIFCASRILNQKKLWYYCHVISNVESLLHLMIK